VEDEEMSGTVKLNQLDELMEKASEALVRTRYFEAEELAASALTLARSAGDFDRMARICMPLQEARRQRLQQALDVNRVTIVKDAVTDEMKVKPGCYLVQPPQVGADARRLRLNALARKTPIAVVCREPRTQLGLWPIVAICPGFSIRVKVDPPSKPEKPTMAWLVSALEALGDEAIASIDAELESDRRVDALLLRLEAHPDHEKLHQALADACRDAARQQERKSRQPVSSPKPARPPKSRPDDEEESSD
jgi:hypothetical protein